MLVFDKLDAFLPRLQYANEELQQKIASDGAEKYSLDLHDSEQEDGNSDPDAKTKPTVEMVLHHLWRSTGIVI